MAHKTSAPVREAFGDLKAIREASRQIQDYDKSDPSRLHRRLVNLEQGMPFEQIQQFLGHAQLDTTQIYAASTPLW